MNFRKLKISNLFILSIFIIFANCNPNRIFKKYIKITDYQWFYNYKINFAVPIDDTTSKYNLNVTVRFIYGFPYKDLHIKITRTSPSGQIFETYPSVKIQDEQGKYLGEVIGDIGDLTATVENNISFNEIGIYNIELQHNMNINPVHMIMEIGLIVEKQ